LTTTLNFFCAIIILVTVQTRLLDSPQKSIGFDYLSNSTWALKLLIENRAAKLKYETCGLLV